jgi:hypothetical protein
MGGQVPVREERQMNSIHTALTAGAKFLQLFGEVTKLIEASPTVFNRDINFKLMLMKEQVEQLDRRSERLEKERDHWKRLAEQYQETILKENER